MEFVAYSQGNQDARDGFTREACPYHFGALRTAWLAGFDAFMEAA